MTMHRSFVSACTRGTAVPTFLAIVCGVLPGVAGCSGVDDSTTAARDAEAPDGSPDGSTSSLDGGTSAQDAADGTTTPLDGGASLDSGGSSGGEGGSMSGVQIRLLSYNVKGLPTELDRRRRLQEIGRRLGAMRAEGTAPDFVLLQEAFGGYDGLLEGAGYPHVAFGPSATGGFPPRALSSGLIVLSEHPIEREERLRFEECAGADCGAAKGVLAVRVRLPGVASPFWVITTHLQAHGENDPERRAQIDQLSDWLDELGAWHAPHLFAGDFNFKAKDDHPSHPSYVRFLERAPYDAPSGKLCLDEPACTTLAPPPATEDDLWWSTPDHQFFLREPSSGIRMGIVRYEVAFTEPFDGDPLSDHWARLGVYTLRASR